MSILKGKCPKCRDRHICGISDIISPDDIAEAKKKYGIKLEIKVTACNDYRR